MWRYSHTDDMIASRMPSMVKGIGFKNVGGVKALDDDDPTIFTRVEAATRALHASVKKSYKDPAAVRKSMSPEFANQFGLFLQGGPQNQFMQQAFNAIAQTFAELGKNITLTSPLSTGFVPFDLLAPSRLLYPFYAPLRNKLPRTQGQGTARVFKAITAIAGSGGFGAATGGPQRISISELNGGSLSANWPISLPAAGSQTANDVTVPYKFMALSESLSWLAQFSGQGFEDISALANLILLQEFMMGEEYQILSGTKTALTVPSAPVIALRTAGSNETAVAAAGGGNSYYIRITGLNFYGETTMSAAGEAAVGATATDVIDVTNNFPRGTWAVNIYISAAAGAGSAPAGRASYFRQASNIGATKFTIQGTLQSSGTTPPAADTGTNSANDFEGMLSILDGHAVTDAAVYPAGYTGGYVNKAVGAALSITVMYNMLQGLYDNSITPNTGNGGFRADPPEFLASGSDLRHLADNIAQNQGNTNYQLMIQQSETGGIKAGVAVSAFQNPITRTVMALMPHPWFPQGTAMALSYQLPIPNSNVSNVWEMSMVQDYLSVAWPVIDPSFRYSMFAYGALIAAAPFYCGLLGGLQQSTTTPWS